MTHTSKILNNILKKVSERAAQDQNSLIVFDLDSTLFDVSPRLQQILIDFAKHPDHQRRFPESVPLMKDIRTHRNDWGIKDAILRAGLHTHSEEFLESLRKWWREHFFSNHYVHYDEPYEGAVHYVNKLWSLGAHISYLTGRDVERMGKGSLEVLKKWGFPADQERADLILKPKAGMDDAKFKSDWFKHIKTLGFADLFFFENEPVNVHKIIEEHPEVEIIFFDSTHSKKALPPEQVPKITHYRVDSFFC